MYNMWTAYTGPWNDKLAYQSPSTALGTEVKAFVRQLGLVPYSGFPKKGVVKFPNETNGPGHVIVAVVTMTYPGFKTVGGYHTPLFVFNLVVSATKMSRISRGQSGLEVVYRGLMNVTFMENYPNDYPTFKLPEYEGFDGGQHNNHMYTGGRMCLYGNYGHSAKAWDSERGTAAEAFGPAMSWIVWHERDRNRGVDADDINRLQRSD